MDVEEDTRGAVDELDRDPEDPGPQEKRANVLAAKQFRRAKALIAETLEDASLEKAEAETETVSEADRARRDDSLGTTLSQASQIKSALADLNKLVKAKKAGGFISPSEWPVTGRSFYPSWYRTHDSAYSVKRTVASDEVRSWSTSPLAGFPQVLERVAAALHMAVAISGFLNQATATLIHLLANPQGLPLSDLSDLAASANRAALHLLGQAFLASANLDLYRRDVVLKNCPKLPRVPASQLRASPLGSEFVFDPLTAEDVFDKYEEAVVRDSGSKDKKDQPFRDERAGSSGQPSRKGQKPAGHRRRHRRGKKPSKRNNNNNNNPGGNNNNRRGGAASGRGPA